MKKNLLFLTILTICCNVYSQENCNSSRIKYLEANPDVKKANLDPWSHYTNYGKREGRVWAPCSDEKKRDSRPKDQANVFWNGAFNLYSLTSDIEILPNSSGEYVFWGTTNENPVPTEHKMKIGTSKTVYKFIDYRECVLFCNEVRKAKGMNLFEVPSILNRGKWEAKGKTVFEKSLSQEWVESSNGNSFVYNEVSADDRGVLLKDRNRNGVFIYLENDKCQYKDLNTDWIIVYYGNWEDDKAEILITDEDKVITENDIKILLGDSELETPVSDKNIFIYPKNELELLHNYNSYKDKWTGIEYLKYVIKNTIASDDNSIFILAFAHLFKIIDQSVYFHNSTSITQEEWKSNYEMLSIFPANIISKGDSNRAFYLLAFIVCGQKTNNNTIKYWKAILEEYNSENCPLGTDFYAQCIKVSDEYDKNLKSAENQQAKTNADNLLKSQMVNYFSQAVQNGIKESKQNLDEVLNGNGCSHCWTSGKCKKCTGSQYQFFFKANQQCSNRNSTAYNVGYNICTKCKGSEYILAECNGCGNDKCRGELCNNKLCSKGWTKCIECNSNNSNNQIGKCIYCKGTGKTN